MPRTVTKKVPAESAANDAPLLGVFDGGNHGSACYFGAIGASPVVRSLFTPLPSGMSPRRCSLASPIIETDGKRYHIGTESAFYDGSGSVATGDKTDQTKLMFLASVPTEACGQDIKLIALHHSPHDLTTALKIQQSLQGEHHWVRNGIALSINVKTVEVQLEGAGTWHLIHPEGMADHWSLIVDIGGGTIKDQ